MALWTLLWPVTSGVFRACRDNGRSWHEWPKCSVAPLVLHIPALAPTWHGEGPRDIKGGTGPGVVWALGATSQYSVSGGTDQLVGTWGAELSSAPATTPSMPSNLVGNPETQGFVWSSASGNSPQELSPVERRLRV